MNPHTPKELSDLIAAALTPLSSQRVTVRGTLVDLHLGSRWGRGRIVQDNPDVAGSSIARIDFGLPGYQAQAIAARCHYAGAPLANGRTVDVSGTINHHPIFGLQLTADDICAVGASPAAVRADALRAKLRQSTEPTNQGNLVVDFSRVRKIALIRPLNGHAGSADAVTSLNHELTLHGLRPPFINTIGIPMSGPQALRELEAALAAQSLTADVILIVRGGGSAADLTMWDHERTCTLLASCTTPIVLGIGHTTDELNAEWTVFHAARTPTAAGQWLGERIRNATAPLPALSVASGIVTGPPPPRPPAPQPISRRGFDWNQAALIAAALIVLVIALGVLGALR